MAGLSVCKKPQKARGRAGECWEAAGLSRGQPCCQPIGGFPLLSMGFGLSPWRAGCLFWRSSEDKSSLSMAVLFLWLSCSLRLVAGCFWMCPCSLNGRQLVHSGRLALVFRQCLVPSTSDVTPLWGDAVCSIPFPWSNGSIAPSLAIKKHVAYTRAASLQQQKALICLLPSSG